MTIFEKDQGTAFGTWPDATSRLMYHDCMPALLNGIEIPALVADYGGGNGLLKQWIPQAISIDCDPTKSPDIYDDVLTHEGSYELVVMRYLLHYLTDDQVLALFKQLRAVTPRVLVIQFVNADLGAKEANSVGETKYFRTESHLHELLLTAGWWVTSRKALDYAVAADFYRNRLGHPNPTAHRETIVALELVQRP